LEGHSSLVFQNVLHEYINIGEYNVLTMNSRLHPQPFPNDAPYFVAHEPAALCANQALARMRDQGLQPVPQNFELWYAYYAQSNLDVVRTIDSLGVGAHLLTDQRCDAIHQEFLSNAREGEVARQASATIQATIDGFSSRLAQAKTATGHYRGALEEAAHTLSHTDNVVAMRTTLQSVLDSTGDMIAHNQRLAAELERSAQAMKELEGEFERVRKQSLTDSLTALPNRKAFDAELERLWQEASEQGAAFCMLMVDIDHFKVFNDTYGHLVGDEVLRIVARTLKEGLAAGEMAARYGGEEFAVLLPGRDLQAGLVKANALRTQVHNMLLTRRATGEKIGRVTVSGGVAQCRVPESAQSLVARADSALYEAKRNGRNRIASAAA